MENDRSNGRAGVAVLDLSAAKKQEILTLSPFVDLPPERRDALLGMGKLERLPRRHALATQGEPIRSFVLIGAGRVKVERKTGERALSLGHRGPGDVVGETALDGAPAATESVTVLDELVALSLPMEALRERLAADAKLCAAVTAIVVAQHRDLERRLMGLLMYSVEARLASFLLEARRRWGSAHAEGEVVSAPFTHAEIATLIGSTRETVTLMLGKLKREGVLGFDRRRIVIRDRGALEQRATSTAR